MTATKNATAVKQLASQTLDRTCEECGGDGRIGITDSVSHACTGCGGSGYALTPLGREILEFLDRHRPV
jgi:DnaJ-class molecular chaperone